MSTYGAIATSTPKSTKSPHGNTYDPVHIHEGGEEDQNNTTSSTTLQGSMEDINGNVVQSNGNVAININTEVEEMEDANTCKDYTRIRVGSDDVTREGSFGDTRRTKDKENFPSEKRKTLVAGVWLLACMTLTALFITLTHDRFPPYATNHPLPDIILDNWDVQEWAFPASEKCIFALIVVWCAIVLFHRHKWIVLRRQFFIIGLWYLYRCVTMVVTNLPRTYEGWICSPKTTGYFVDVITMWIRVITSGGSSAGDLHTCGDYVFSGHTSAMVTLTLFIQEYSPRRFWPLHWACGITSLVGVVFILIGKGHYTLDCVVAYFVCTRLFWMYHTMAATSSSSNRRISLRHSDRSFQINRTMWYSMFHYFECNVKGLVPRQYGWPLPWPRNWAERDFDYEVVR